MCKRFGFQCFSELFNCKNGRYSAFKRSLKYCALCLALGAACFSAPASAQNGSFPDKSAEASESLYRGRTCTELYLIGLNKEEAEAFGYMRAAATAGEGEKSADAMFWLGDYFYRYRKYSAAEYCYNQAYKYGCKRSAHNEYVFPSNEKKRSEFFTQNSKRHLQEFKKPYYDESQYYGREAFELFLTGSDKEESEAYGYMRAAATIAKGPNSREAMLWLGDYYNKYKQYSQAYYWYEQAAWGDAPDGGEINANTYVQALAEYKAEDIKRLPSSERYRAESQEKNRESQSQYGKANKAYNNGNYTQAFRLFKEVAEQGDTKAQYSLASMYEKGQGTDRNLDAAFEWYKKAAEQGHSEAQRKLGMCYLFGKGTAADYAAAALWCKKAAAQNDSFANCILGCMAAAGAGVEQSSMQSYYYFQKVDKAEIPAAGYYVYLMRDQLTPKQHEKLEFEIVDCCKYGKCTYIISNRTVTMKKAEIPEWYNAAAGQGANGFNYSGSITVDIYQNTSQYDSIKPYEAFKKGAAAVSGRDPSGYGLLESSARRGCNHAKIALANLVLPEDHPLKWKDNAVFDFKGRDKDYRQIYLKWMNSAAENGSAAAAKELADMYREEIEVGKDVSQIFRYTKLAALANEPECSYRLGTYYIHGIGCKKDRSNGVKWIKQAARLGNKEASEWLDDRRGHYVDEAIGSEYVRPDKAYDKIDDDFIKDYKNNGERYAVDKAARGLYKLTVDTFCKYCLGKQYTGSCHICGVVKSQFNMLGKHYAVLSYNDNNIIICDDKNLIKDHWINHPLCVVCDWTKPYSIPGTDKLCCLTAAETRNLGLGCVELGRYYKKNVYKKVWQGPKIKGWEDLLNSK